MKMERVDHAEILTAARSKHGLVSMRQIRYAVLERDGSISIIPNETAIAKPTQEDATVSP
jgi:uncharacterized membrane protein YcaP (DUF421 family)